MNDINLNIATCFRDVTRFGQNEIFNVCNGTSSFVPWGLGQWIGASILGLVFAVVVFGVVWWNIPYIAWQLRGRKPKGERT